MGRVTVRGLSSQVEKVQTIDDPEAVTPIQYSIPLVAKTNGRLMRIGLKVVAERVTTQ
jgi:hypothetical protein